MKKLTYINLFLINLLVFGFSQPDINSIKQLVKQSNISENEIKNFLIDNNINPPVSGRDGKKNNMFDNGKVEIIKDIDLIKESNKVINSSKIENLDLNIDMKSENDDDQNSGIVKLDAEKIFLAKPDSNIYYGYATFLSDPDLFQKSSDVSASPNYQVGPGDEIIIMLWGQTEDLSNYIVSRDGYIFIPNIGQVFVNGMTLGLLEKKLKKILKKAYSSLSSDTQKGTTFLDVSLGSAVLKPIRIFVMGEVSLPGAYEVKPSTSLFTSLYYFNGPKTSGSLRDIKLIRNGKEISSIDFYDFLLTGKKLNDLQLQNDDVVFISERQKSVTLKGEIKKASIFELKYNETYNDLLKIVNGYKSTTYMKRARLDRIIDRKDRLKSGGDRKIIDLDLFAMEKNEKDLDLLDGDIITFFKISDFQIGSIEIEGPVKRPGKYSLTEGMKIIDLINKADGFQSNDVYREKVEITRLLDGENKKLISVNLDSVIAKKSTHNIALLSGDSVKIFSRSDMLHSTGVSIEGFVLNPGLKEFKEGMTVFDLIFMGGGFENDDRISKTYLDRADYYSFNKSKMRFSFQNFRLDSVLLGRSIASQKLNMGDKIFIYSKDDVKGISPDYVEVSGYVKYPGKYFFGKGMTIKDLFFQSKGVLDDDFFNNTFKGRADIIRYDKKLKNQKIISFNIEDLLKNEKNDIDLVAGDRLIVYSDNIFSSRPDNVFLSGSVISPGTYEYLYDMRLGDLILISGGLDDNFGEYKIEISRILDSESEEDKIAEIISFKFLNNPRSFENFDNSNLNYRLKPFDHVSIKTFSNTGYQKVTILGEVVYPGEYILSSKKDKLYYLLKRAGGLTSYANSDASVVTRNGNQINIKLSEGLKNKNSRYNLLLMDGDTIEVKARTNLISIVGGVSAPGNYQFIKDYSLNDYINLAGGYSENAVKSKVFITYPNGTSKKVSYARFSPKVLDNSIINVPLKSDTEPFNVTEYLTNISDIYADLVQSFALISILGNSN